jgi:hypothetical protein
MHANLFPLNLNEIRIHTGKKPLNLTPRKKIVEVNRRQIKIHKTLDDVSTTDKEKLKPSTTDKERLKPRRFFFSTKKNVTKIWHPLIIKDATWFLLFSERKEV